MGIFGNPASIIIDFNLVVQYVTLILLLFGYIKRGGGYVPTMFCYDYSNISKLKE